MLADAGGVTVVPDIVEPVEGNVPGGDDEGIELLDDILSLAIGASVPMLDFLPCFLWVVDDGMVPGLDWSAPGVDVVDEPAI